MAERVKRSLAKKQRLNHYPTPAQVLVLSWVSVLAVTTPRVSGAVQKAQRQSWATVADLAMPWPEAMASLIRLVEVEDADLIRFIRSTAQSHPVEFDCAFFAPRVAPMVKASGPYGLQGEPRMKVVDHGFEKYP